MAVSGMLHEAFKLTCHYLTESTEKRKIIIIPNVASLVEGRYWCLSCFGHNPSLSLAWTEPEWMQIWSLQSVKEEPEKGTGIIACAVCASA